MVQSKALKCHSRENGNPAPKSTPWISASACLPQAGRNDKTEEQKPGSSKIGLI